MEKPIIALQTYTIQDLLNSPAEIKETFKAVRKIGYTALELCIPDCIETAYLKEILDGERLEVCGIHAGRLDDISIGSIENTVNEYKVLGCDYLAYGMPQEYRGSREGFITFVKEMNEYGRIFSEYGMRLYFHNHNYEFQRFDGTTGMEILVDRSDPRYVDFEIDTCWVQAGGGDPIQWILRLKDRMKIVHFKDMYINNELERLQIVTEVGEGNMNWEGIIDACKKTRVKYYCVEQDDCERSPLESIEISYKNIMKML